MGTRFPDLHYAPWLFLSWKSTKGGNSQPHPLPQHNSISACSCYCLNLASEAGIKWPMSIYLWGPAVNQISIWTSHVWSSNYLEVFDVDSSGSHHKFCIMLVFFFFFFPVLSLLPACSDIIWRLIIIFEIVILSLTNCSERTLKSEKKQV